MAQRSSHKCDPAVCGPAAAEPDRSAPMAVWSCWAMNRAEAQAEASAQAATAPSPKPARTAAKAAGATSPPPSVDLSALDCFYWPGGHLSR